MERIIVHSDINHCYAQIEEMLHPGLRSIPMAVGGSEEKRHGIILARNDLAKAFGVKTGESLREARKKCPDLKIIHPDYDQYLYYTEKIKDIYRKYTDRVESFGLDEAWMDLTHSQLLFGDGIDLAAKIQDEVYQRYGITVSMGISFNKVFAKLGSDLLKHKGFVVISESNYQEFLWPLPVENLLMVGSRTKRKLNGMGIFTIGELARYPADRLEKALGVIGSLLWRYANGLDQEEVHKVGYVRPVKSIGNSKTVVHDIESMGALKEVLRVLCESVAIRLRQEGARAKTISIWLRDTELKGRGCQMRLVQPSDLAADLLQAAMCLVYRLDLDEVRLRSVGVHTSNLSYDTSYEQLDLFSDPLAREKERKKEQVLYEIQSRYGFNSCRMASSRLEKELTDFSPLDLLHQVHPIGVLEGPVRS